MCNQHYFNGVGYETSVASQETTQLIVVPITFATGLRRSDKGGGGYLIYHFGKS